MKNTGLKEVLTARKISSPIVGLKILLQIRRSLNGFITMLLINKIGRKEILTGGMAKGKE